ncbi:MAG: helix-hairpin-helix domain-containing protein, partial [Candidatus Aenigmarchaeota archaeon]|nr:helix-hairpin-helix domain-containing protein [Candidatus Aenigmarchaeota archaeon]MDI6722962.1 helix-hairpin-helix domain-containing protein [Candidatus Aenigmarchaeota archaeon]
MSRQKKPESEEEKTEDIKEEEPLEEKKEITIEDLPGIGPKGAEKLRLAGYTDLLSIASASAGDIIAACDIGEATADKIIAAARQMADVGGFKTGYEVLSRRKEIGKITTGSKSLDALLGGGVETQAITEAYGAFGCLTSDEMITLADGSMIPIGNIASNFDVGIHNIKVPIITVSKGSLTHICATKLYVYDCKNVLEVMLENGMTLKVTPNHPLMTPDGWKKAEK